MNQIHEIPNPTPEIQETWFDRGEPGPHIIQSAIGLKAGSMSPLWQPDAHPQIHSNRLPDDVREAVTMERRETAESNLERFFRRYGIKPQDVTLLKPQPDRKEPRFIDVTDSKDIARIATETTPAETEPGFMAYSTDPDRPLALNVADSPVIYGYGKKESGETIQVIMPGGWEETDAGLIERSLDYLRDELSFDASELKWQISAGAEDLQVKRYKDPEDSRSKRFPIDKWGPYISNEEDIGDAMRFTIDLKGAAAGVLEAAGVAADQIVIDRSDTTYHDEESGKESGYSSHRRKTSSRDVVVGMTPDYFEKAQERSTEYLRELGSKATQS